jgi:hypothetical protein
MMIFLAKIFPYTSSIKEYIMGTSFVEVATHERAIGMSSKTRWQKKEKIIKNNEVARGVSLLVIINP